MNIGEMFVRATVDATGVTSGINTAVRDFNRFGQATTRFGGAVTSAGLNTNRLTGTLLSLTSQVTGVNPAVLRLTNIISTLAITGPMMVGVLAGMTAFGVTLQLRTKDAKDFEKALLGVGARLDELANKQGFDGDFQALKDQATARAAIAGIMENMAAKQEQIGRIGALGLPGIGAEGARKELVALQADLELWTTRLNAATVALQKANPEVEGITVTMASFAQRTQEAREAMQKQIDQQLRWAGEGINIGKLGVKPGEAMGGISAPDVSGSAARDMVGAPAVGRFAAALDVAKGALTQFGPTALMLGAAFEIIRGIMVPLQPILEVFKGFLQSIGELLGSLIAPVLKLVATGFSWVLQAIGFFVEGIGKFIDAIVPDWISKVGKGLAAQGQSMQDHAKAMRDSLNAADGVTAAFEGLTAATRNVPTGFKTNLARFNADNAGGAGSAPSSGGNPIEQFTITGDLHFHGVQNVEDLGKQVRRLARRGGGVPLQPAYE